MKVLALDLSSRAGWAFFEDAQLFAFGIKELPKTVHAYGDYPWNYIEAATDMVNMLLEKVEEYNPEVVVIEEINLGKSRYSQRILEWIHCILILRLRGRTKVIYVSSSAWRKTLKLEMSKEDKRNNAKLSTAKRKASAGGGKLDKKSLGIKGKITKKHLSVRYVNDTYGLNFKIKDNDMADAICLGAAYLIGAPYADGVM